MQKNELKPTECKAWFQNCNKTWTSLASDSGCQKRL